jgi:hypothetical protein
VAGALTLLGWLSFALLHLSYNQFFEHFGLVPEDVGLDFSRILTTSLSAIFIAFLAWTIVAAFLLVPLIVALPWDDPEEGGGHGGPSTFRCVILLALAFVSGICARELWLHSRDGHELKLAACVVVGAPLAIALVGRSGASRAKETWEHMAGNRRTIAVIVWIAVVALGLGTTLAGLRRLGRTQRTRRSRASRSRPCRSSSRLA